MVTKKSPIDPEDMAGCDCCGVGLLKSRLNNFAGFWLICERCAHAGGPVIGAQALALQNSSIELLLKLRGLVIDMVNAELDALAAAKRRTASLKRAKKKPAKRKAKKAPKRKASKKKR